MQAFLETVGNIILFLVVLSVVICIHELGHFFFARRAGILCHEFSFGMGPRIWSKKFGETVFSIRALPFGGFVSMAGEELDSDVVKVGDKIRLGFDENQMVSRIVVKADNPKYADMLEVKIERLDLKGGSTEGLYINEYPVKANAHYVYERHSMQIAPTDRNFNSKTKAQRFWVTFGGPMMNIVLAFFVYLLSAFLFGVAITNIAEVGDVSPTLPAYNVVLPGDVITAVNGVSVTAWTSKNSAEKTVTSELAKYQEYDTVVLTVRRNGETLVLPAIQPQYILYGLGFSSTLHSDALLVGTPIYTSYTLDGEDADDGIGLKAGDLIVSINDQVMTDWDDILDYAAAHTNGENLDVVVDRDGEMIHVRYTPLAKNVLDAMGYEPFYARIGITATTGFSFFGSFRVALENLGNASITIYKTLWLLITSKQVGIGDMSGFIGIYTATANAAAQGFQTLLGWIGLLSVNLGIVNLLPIPALDGGRIAFIAYEAVAKKKPNQKFEGLLNTITFFLLIGLMIFITYKDILRLFQ
ncbi:MAG TPA: RIP metalloprotease RseP [Bacillota bacterium]|nr:RIP metalloprotease RseP [Bacillota bacterium]